MGEVKTYFLSKEELEQRQQERRAKYGDQPAKKIYDFRSLSEERYNKYKAQGMTDNEVVKEIKWLDAATLEREKERWRNEK